VQLLLSGRRIDPAVRNGFGLVQPNAPLDPMDRGLLSLLMMVNFIFLTKGLPCIDICGYGSLLVSHVLGHGEQAFRSVNWKYEHDL